MVECGDAVDLTRGYVEELCDARQRSGGQVAYLSLYLLEDGYQGALWRRVASVAGEDSINQPVRVGGMGFQFVSLSHHGFYCFAYDSQPAQPDENLYIKSPSLWFVAPL